MINKRAADWKHIQFVAVIAEIVSDMKISDKHLFVWDNALIYAWVTQVTIMHSSDCAGGHFVFFADFAFFLELIFWSHCCIRIISCINAF